MKKIWKHRYQILEQKGAGGSGCVYKVWDLHLEKEWAMKILENRICMWSNTEEYGETMNEWKALKQIAHPNFPRIVDAFEEEGRSVLVMDHIQGVTLEEVIAKGPLKEEEMGGILIQICEALLYLHQSNPTLLYLDLKPSNIMIEENKTVKLVDLGSVSIKGMVGKISGSFGYASPEQVKVRKDGIYLREQSDIFSFGMVLYAMATGSSNRLPVINEKSRHGVFIGGENPFLSAPLERIIEKCTRGNWNRRYGSMREVKRDIEIWEASLKKKSLRLMRTFRRKSNRKQWYQERSIFCTEGRHSFYIAKKLMMLLIGILCLVPEKMIRADEKGSQKACIVKQEEVFTESEFEETDSKLGVIIRDYEYRKVLLKKNCAYETAGGILLEIPWEEIEGEHCKILVECEDESRQKKQFYLECIHKNK